MVWLIVFLVGVWIFVRSLMRMCEIYRARRAAGRIASLLKTARVDISVTIVQEPSNKEWKYPTSTEEIKRVANDR